MMRSVARLFAAPAPSSRLSPSRALTSRAPLVALAALASCAPAAPPAVQAPSPPRAAPAAAVAGAPNADPAAAPAALGVAAAAPASAKPPAVVYVRAGKLFDGTGDRTREGVVIVVEGDRIQRVAAAREVTIPAGARVVDLSNATVLPGLIDCHVHLGQRADRYEEIYAFKDTPFQEAFAAVVHAKRTLDAGFTTVRDVGSSPFMAVDLKRSIDEGLVPGPRIVASGPLISITGGHGDLNDYSPQTRVSMFPDERDYGVADGVDQIRHVVRAQIKYGVDVVKVAASGGVLSRGDQPGAPQYTVEELRALVEEAHAAGRKVAAHAHGAQGIKNATIAGVDSIEHGSLIDDEGIRLMKARGTWLDADVYNDDYLLGQAVALKIPQEFVDKERALGQRQREGFARAVRAGVKIAFGTDAGVYPHGDNARQLAIMVRYGMTPAGAIRAATSSAAELIDRAKDVGTIAPGRYADIIATTADPLADVRALEHVAFVMKGGAVVKDEITSKR